MIVVVVGVCGSGKTTLVKNLQKNGIDAYNVAQEHSCIKQLWKHKKPDKVIMLEYFSTLRSMSQTGKNTFIVDVDSQKMINIKGGE